MTKAVVNGLTAFFADPVRFPNSWLSKRTLGRSRYNPHRRNASRYLNCSHVTKAERAVYGARLVARSRRPRRRLLAPRPDAARRARRFPLPPRRGTHRILAAQPAVSAHGRARGRHHLFHPERFCTEPAVGAGRARALRPVFYQAGLPHLSAVYRDRRAEERAEGAHA